MKALTMRLTKEERALLQRVKDTGFSSIGEVIKCAALSLESAAPKKGRKQTQPA